MRNFFLATLIGAGLALPNLTLPAFAQDKDAPPPLTVKSAEVTRLDTVPNYNATDSLICCAMEVFESGPDQDFVYLHILFDVEWSEDVQRISYYGGDAIFLKLPGQTDPETFQVPWGQMDWFPEARATAPSINVNRDRKWPEVDNDVYLDAFFTVPFDVTEAILVIGKKDEPQKEFTIDLSGDVVAFETAGSLWDVEIKGIGKVDEIATERDMRGAMVRSRIAPNAGQIVKIDMSLTPKRDLKADRLTGSNSASFTSRHVGLVGPEGLPLALIGEARENRGHL